MTEGRFSDHFSNDSAEYRRARPRYPMALFEYVVSLAPGRSLAWDCATGNGQAALSVAEHFDHVVATDASQEQLSHAAPHPKVEYRNALAHDSGLETDSVDLLTIAAALHWFAKDDFFAEVRRVLKPGGVIAAWSYGARIEVDPKVDEAILRFGAEVLGPYWPPEFQYNVSGYRTLPFPFEELEPPSVDVSVDWTLEDLISNVRTWSGYSGFTKQNGREPLEELEARLRPAWGEHPTRTVRWPLHFKIGRVT